jgi:hypothetical protein
MDLNQAHKLFLDFVRSELKGKGGYYTGWIRIDGSRICDECTKHKRKSLYILMKEGFRPFLKCFRISCDIKRYITREDFNNFGFTDKEAIKCLLDDTISYNTKTERDIKNSVPLIITDYNLDKVQAKYLKDRTWLEDDYDTINKFRIIPNLADAIYETYENDPETLAKFGETNIKSNKHNITFASENYNMYFYRDIFDPKIKLKFSTGTTEPYILKNSDDPSYLVVAEGVFDIINAYTKFAVIDKAVYIATGGAQAIFNEICNVYAQYVETLENLILFADSDIKIGENKYNYDKKFYNNLIKKLDKTLGKNAFKHIFIVYNKKSKDFGDMREDILADKIQIR